MSNTAKAVETKLRAKIKAQAVAIKLLKLEVKSWRQATKGKRKTIFQELYERQLGDTAYFRNVIRMKELKIAQDAILINSQFKAIDELKEEALNKHFYSLTM